MAKAEKIANDGAARWGAHSVTVLDWTVALYDIGNDNDFDALFVCSGPSDGKKRGALIVYSVGDASNTTREFYAEELKAMWRGQ